jgi:starvation-inducible DNA-binding protein
MKTSRFKSKSDKSDSSEDRTAGVKNTWLQARNGAQHGAEGLEDVAASLNILLADTFALYLKTKGFHWHIGGRHFRDYHLMLDEQAEQIFEMTDALAERVRKLGFQSLRSIGAISRLQRITDTEDVGLSAEDMLAVLKADNIFLEKSMKNAHRVCDEVEDVASASLLENWIDEAQRRIWFLIEAARA